MLVVSNMCICLARSCSIKFYNPAIFVIFYQQHGFYFPTIQSDGKILATNQNQIYRFNSDGTVDFSFANSGHTNSVVTSMALQSVQKIVGCRRTQYWSGDNYEDGLWSGYFTTVTRFNADGSADNTFGNLGVIPPLLFGANPCQAISVQPDGKIIIGGNFWTTNSGDPNTSDPNLIYVMRLNLDGSLDSSFATGGCLPIQFMMVAPAKVSLPS